MVQDFLRDGFVIFKKQFSRDLCEVMGREIESVHEQFPELKQKVPALQKLGEWCIKNPHLASAMTKEFILSKPFQELSHSLIGPDVDLYWATTAAKPAQTGKAFPWHQDVGYEEEPRDYITCWTALDFVDEDNGCLWAIPGSHLWPVLPHEFRKSNDRDYGGVFVKEVNFDESSRIALRLEPGDIACMHSKLVHCTYGNASARKRRGLISAFGEAKSHHQKHIRGYEEAPIEFLRRGQIL